ncbi:MAG: hypothetical protein JWN48_5867 [Myxococcaceae bacterium]|nr:hypothetical protein [Myxococcaceae bacterium]
MTQRNDQGGGQDATSGQQQDQKGNVQQQIQGAADKLGEKARGAVSSARDTVAHAEDRAAALAHDVRDTATEQYQRARDYALDEAQQLGERARRAGYVGADYARRAGASTGQFVTTNALPLTLIGAGIGWLAWSLRQQRQRSADLELDLYGDEDDFDEGIGEFPIRERYDARRDQEGDASTGGRLDGLVSGARDAAGQARERVGALTDRATQSASQLADRAAQGGRAIADRATQTASALAERATHGAEVVRTRVTDAATQLSHQAGELSHEARERVRLAGLRTRDFADENPLMVGAIAIAAGVGIGLLLPNTQPENRLLGETRDRLLGDARGLLGDARGIIDEARDTALQTADQIGRHARETAQEIRNQVSDSRISH